MGLRGKGKISADDRIEFFNPGGLPAGLTVEKLLKGDYISHARNKKIADAFKAAGLIEKYGSGIKRILNAFKVYGLRKPHFEETSGGFMVTAYKKGAEVAGRLSATSEVESRLESRLESPLAAKILLILTKNDQGKAGLAYELGHRTVSGELHKQVKRLQTLELIEMTIPDKPNSRLQKYRLTAKGKECIKKLRDK